MASLEQRSGHYHVVFRFGGRKFSRSLSTDNEAEAERLVGNLEQTIRDVKNGRIHLPDDADVATFLLSDGKLTEAVSVSADSPVVDQVQLSLRELFERFFAALPETALEQTTLSTMQTHRRNLLRILGDRILADDVDLNLLDRFVRRRCREPGRRGRKVGVVTIQKELATLRRVWRWAHKRSLVAAEFPELRDIQLPKSREQLPFQTFDEITFQIEQNTLSETEQADLWDSLYLRTTEIAEVLAHIRQNSQVAFLYPMVVAAAHTGARRSELMRSELTDIRGDVLIIREKKRKRSQQTTRRVPMSTFLKGTLDEWRAIHPGGRYTFGVAAGSSRAANPPLHLLTPDQAHGSFRQAVRASCWDVIPGWHCFRHSFISNMASAGVDQRLIDEFVGHTTEEMRRRYRHLLPEVKQAAIDSVFG